MIDHKPIPGPMYWDFKCLQCDGLVKDHAPWWRRAIAKWKDGKK